MDQTISKYPSRYQDLLNQTEAHGFSMASDPKMGSFLRTLVASKPHAHFLELGTGTGLALAWIVAGLDGYSRVLSVEKDPALAAIARHFFKDDNRVDVHCEDGSTWIKTWKGDAFDLIFADAWPGKYSLVDETLHLLKPGGFYIVDDMTPHPNWPEGHAAKAEGLLTLLMARKDLYLTKIDWSTGIIIAVKKS